MKTIELIPYELLPTTRQQRSRVCTKGGFDSLCVSVPRFEESSLSTVRILEKKPKTKAGQDPLDKAALNVALKLLRTAFSRYSQFKPPAASRAIPSKIVLGNVSPWQFKFLVAHHVRGFLRPGCQFLLELRKGRLELSVCPPKEPWLKPYAYRSDGTRSEERELVTI